MPLRLVATSVVAVLLAAIGVTALQQAQSPQATPTPTPRPTGAIAGRVLEGDGSAPATGVTVTLARQGTPPVRVLVDAQGRFVFTALPAGAFTITANRSGYLTGSYGSLRADGAGRPLHLADGERVTDAVVRVWRFGTISGRVTDDAGEPVPGATVQAWKRTVVAGRWRLAGSNQNGTADDRGVYRITGLTPGEYALVITNLSTSLPISLMEEVDASRRSTAAGRPTPLPPSFQPNGVAGFASDLMQGFPTTRVGDLLLQTSGRTIVGADNRSIEAYPTVWYPSGATPLEAGLLRVAAGEEKSGIDLHPTLTKTRKISGVVTGPEGPMTHLALRLVPARLDEAAAEITSSLSLSLTISMTASDANGAFTFVGVPPGQYVIRALTTPRPAPIRVGPDETFPIPVFIPSDPTLWTETPVSVGDTDTTGVTVSLRTGLRISGRAEFAGSAVKPTPRDLAQLPLVMDSADGRSLAAVSSYRAQIDAEGRFNTTGLMAGRYLLRIDRHPTGWMLKSAMLNGKDICDVPVVLSNSDLSGLVITFTDRPTMVSGTVRDNQGQLDEDATVLVFPADGNWIDQGPNPRRFRGMRVSRTGAFSTAGLPPGDYHAVAISDALASGWQDPVFLKKLAGVANRVTLTDGQTLTLNLTRAEGVTR